MPFTDLSNRRSEVGLEDGDKWVKYRRSEPLFQPGALRLGGRVIGDQEILDAAEELVTEVNTVRSESVPDSAVGDLESPRPSSSEASTMAFMSDAFDTLYDFSEYLYSVLTQETTCGMSVIRIPVASIRSFVVLSF